MAKKKFGDTWFGGYVKDMVSGAGGAIIGRASKEQIITDKSELSVGQLMGKYKWWIIGILAGVGLSIFASVSTIFKSNNKKR
jgi:hypothetical protein